MYGRYSVVPFLDTSRRCSTEAIKDSITRDLRLFGPWAFYTGRINETFLVTNFVFLALMRALYSILNQFVITSTSAYPMLLLPSVFLKARSLIYRALTGTNVLFCHKGLFLILENSPWFTIFHSTLSFET